jgi:hypothetical protein
MRKVSILTTFSIAFSCTIISVIVCRSIMSSNDLSERGVAFISEVENFQDQSPDKPKQKYKKVNSHVPFINNGFLKNEKYDCKVLDALDRDSDVLISGSIGMARLSR